MAVPWGWKETVHASYRKEGKRIKKKKKEKKKEKERSFALSVLLRCWSLGWRSAETRRRVVSRSILVPIITWRSKEEEFIVKVVVVR